MMIYSCNARDDKNCCIVIFNRLAIKNKQFTSIPYRKKIAFACIYHFFGIYIFHFIDVYFLLKTRNNEMAKQASTNKKITSMPIWKKWF
jgi:hypothetical protein